MTHRGWLLAGLAALLLLFIWPTNAAADAPRTPPPQEENQYEIPKPAPIPIPKL